MIDGLDKGKIEPYLENIKLRYHVHIYDEVESTNLVAKSFGRQEEEVAQVVLSEDQSAGRGRLSRMWSSYPMRDIYMSMVFTPKIKIKSATMLTIVAALVVRDTVETIIDDSNISVGIKWPNDIIIGSKKVSGILCEMNVSQNELNYVVVGIGININRETFEETLSTATSLHNETEQLYDRNVIIVRLLNQWNSYYERFIKTEDLSNLMGEYNHHLIHNGKEIRVIDKEEYTACCYGIDNLGGLRIKSINTGEMSTLYTGEVSVRSLRGYALD